MASLAVIVGLIFLIVFLSGPTIFLISKYHLLPRIIVKILAIFTICLGLWWTTIVVTPIRLIGLLTAYFGWRAIKNSRSDA